MAFDDIVVIQLVRRLFLPDPQGEDVSDGNGDRGGGEGRIRGKRIAFRAVDLGAVGGEGNEFAYQTQPDQISAGFTLGHRGG